MLCSSDTGAQAHNAARRALQGSTSPWKETGAPAHPLTPVVPAVMQEAKRNLLRANGLCWLACGGLHLYNAGTGVQVGRAGKHSRRAGGHPLVSVPPQLCCVRALLPTNCCSYSTAAAEERGSCSSAIKMIT